MKTPLYVVHCVDTEGPLYESLEATFDRLEGILGRRLPATQATLAELRHGTLDLDGREGIARLIVSEQLLNYNDTWDKVDAMLEEMMAEPFRQHFGDPMGRPWTINWFCVDHVGYDVNPRRRDIGYHNVFDHYRGVLRRSMVTDEIHWHVHPMSTYREAHRNATSYLRSPHVLETLSRRIIDRAWFPVAFRPGFHVERPDSHWLLEQFVPFDFGNQAMPASTLENVQDDLADGRFGDWRRAPHDWSPYRPHHDDYQLPGGCRRTIFRCLNVGTRLRLLDENEVRRAFTRAAEGHPTILAFTDHDFRDMRADIAAVHGLVTDVAPEFPTVEWQNAGVLEACRAVLDLQPQAPLKLDVTFRPEAQALRMDVEASHDIFGPQPFLAIKDHSRQYSFDNFDIQQPFRRWSYMFDEQSFHPDAVETIGLAAADATGQTVVRHFDGRGRPVEIPTT